MAHQSCKTLNAHSSYETLNAHQSYQTLNIRFIRYVVSHLVSQNYGAPRRILVALATAAKANQRRTATRCKRKTRVLAVACYHWAGHDTCLGTCSLLLKNVFYSLRERVPFSLGAPSKWGSSLAGGLARLEH